MKVLKENYRTDQSANLFRLEEVALDKWTFIEFLRWRDRIFEGPFNGIASKKIIVKLEA